MTLQPGTRSGPFRIDAPLGAGGMGEVYRATDTKLGREVAIKVLRTGLADAGQLARFEREARTLAALNHPHIATLYGWEPLDSATGHADSTMLVMELVEGPTLEMKIARGALPINEVVRIGSQIADAVAAAHDHGIVHRDLKPANIKLTRSGAIKVLDFGIAKAIGNADPAAVTAALTEAGQIVGTSAYMSPEQTRGSEIDARADVWAFGCVLFEMLTGRRAFDGATRSDVSAAVLEREPDWTLVPAKTPVGVRVLLRRCLQKELGERLRSMTDARIFLEDLGGTDTSDGPQRARRSLGVLIAASAGAAAVLVGLLTWVLMRPRDIPSEPMQRYEIVTPVTAALNVATTTPALAVAPDGRQLSYVTNSNEGSGGQLMIRTIDDLRPRPIEGAPRVRDHAFSPDGHWIVYLDSSANGVLAKIRVAGGAPVSLCRVEGVIRGPNWGDDGSIVFSTTGLGTGLFKVSSDGGTPVRLTKPDVLKGEAEHLFPSVLPSGRGVLFVIHAIGAGDPEVAVLDSRDGSIKRLVAGAAAARYLDGHLLYVLNGTLYARPFDVERLEITGEQVTIAEGILMPTAGSAYFDVARNGTIVYVPASTAYGPPRRLVWVDRSGRETPVGAPDLPYGIVRLSPQGDRIALTVGDAGSDIYTWNVARQTLARVTVDSRDDFSPVWTADGNDVLYTSRRGSGSVLRRQISDGSAAPHTLSVSSGTWMPTAVTSDGRTLVGQRAQGGVWKLFVLPLDRPDEITTGTDDVGTKWITSPNGRFIAYDQSSSGMSQVYVWPFPETNKARWQVSSGAGGTNPVWRADGRELFYMAIDAGYREGSSEGMLMVAPVNTTGPTFDWQTPQPLFSTAPYKMGPPHPFDVSHDGQRLLMIRNLDVSRDAAGRIVVMLNALKR